MKTKKETVEIINKLKEYYPDATCSLDFSTPFEMMISVMLSAQCTDERVNKTTPSLFAKFNNPESMANADINELEEIIHPCGFYKNKAKNIKACSKKLIEEFDGIVPENMELLQSLPGVGRKSANVIMLEAFHNPQGIAVDTHAKRIPKEMYYDVNHLLVWHGRNICIARNPKCDKCPINKYCDEYKKMNK